MPLWTIDKIFKERLTLRMKRKLVNNETTKNNKIMEQETVNARSDKEAAATICAGNSIAVTSQFVRATSSRTIPFHTPPV